MTIAAGFICSDGIVLAADTKERYGDDHTYVDKLLIIDAPHCLGAIAGSGLGYPLEYISPKIKELFEFKDWIDAKSCETALGSLMTSIYLSKALKAFPRTSADEVATQFLVVVRPNSGENCLFLVNSSLVTRIKTGVQIIGYGLMQEMANELAEIGLSVADAGNAALYLIHETKRRYSYVGGVTHIYKLSSGGTMDFDRTWDQPTREELFNSIRGLHHQMLIAVSNPDLEPWNYRDVMKRLSINARSVRGEFRRIEKKYREWKRA